LYEMATGRAPFTGTTSGVTFEAILNRQPTPPVRLNPDVPQDLERIINTTLEKDRTLRYQTTADLEADLRRIRRDVTARSATVAATVPAAAPRTSSALPQTTVAPTGTRRFGRVGPVVAGVLAVAALGFAVTQFRERRALALTDRDTLLVTDFVNRTGDPVFDGTLKQALTIALEQSPFFSLVSTEDVRETLRLMTKSPDEHLAGDVARDACQRLGARVMVTGSIAQLGKNLVVGLDAVNCQSGETTAREQAEAPRREDVLKTVSVAASRLRPKLGESRATVERFDVPIQRATTPSLDAFKAFKAGEDLRERGRGPDAVAFYKHAIELDPDFATAYARLSTIYGARRPAEMRRNIEEAYARRDRVSERERLYIEGRHCLIGSDPDCYLNVHELWKRTYPRDPIPYGNVAAEYLTRGMCDKGLEDATVGLRLRPSAVFPYMQLAGMFECLGRYSDAKRTIEDAFARGLDGAALHRMRYELAFLDRDAATMAAEHQKVVGRAEEPILAEAESDAAAFEGRMQRSRELRKQAEQLATGRLEEQVLIRALGALYEAAVGDLNRARATLRAFGASLPVRALEVLGAAAVISHDQPRVDALIPAPSPDQDQLPGRLMPLVRLLREVDSGDRSATERMPPAVSQDLAPTPGQAFRPAYVRGLIWLHAGDGNRAAVEFQRILDHRGVAPTSPLYPLAYVQQARAFALSGDFAHARQAYEAFLAIWRNGDPDVSILRAARAEYVRVQGGTR
jgi:tetratricopeptide (TPR) repeat protein